MDLRMREVTVGTIVIVAVARLHLRHDVAERPTSLVGQPVRMQFANVSGLKRASPVRISGVNVGKVESIEFQDVGRVLVTASLPPKIKPRVDASAHDRLRDARGRLRGRLRSRPRQRAAAARAGRFSAPRTPASPAGRSARRPRRQRAASGRR